MSDLPQSAMFLHLCLVLFAFQSMSIFQLIRPPPDLDIENKDALMPDCGVHYLWFAFVCFLITSPPPRPGDSSRPPWSHQSPCGGGSSPRAPAAPLPPRLKIRPPQLATLGPC